MRKYTDEDISLRPDFLEEIAYILYIINYKKNWKE